MGRLRVSREEARERVFDSDGALDSAALRDGSIYQSATTFQLKAMLFHAGILTERGSEPGVLDPTADVWRLLTPLDR